MAIELLTIAFAAPGTKRFERAGRYIEVIDASGAVDIVLGDSYGAQTGYARGALSGIYMNGAFSSIQLASATAQTITLMITDGEGGSRRQPGVVRVIDEITDALAVYTASPGLAQTVFTSTQIVAPAANVRGLILRAGEANAQAGAPGASTNISFLACKSAPTSYTAPSQRWNVVGAHEVAGALKVDSWRGNKLIPPGWGLYFSREVIAANALVLNGSISYEML